MIDSLLGIPLDYDALRKLGMFIAGMAIYSIFVFKFYRFVARKDIFKLDLQKYNYARHPAMEKFVHLILYVLEYIILMPVLVFFWFTVLSALLAFLAESQTIDVILLSSVALVGSVRVTAYYNENLSQDLAKMLPFALLGVFLVNVSTFNFTESLSLIMELPLLWQMMLNYLLFVVALELVMRILHGIFSTGKASSDRTVRGE